MHWRVVGASVKTGRDVEVTFDAATYDEAESMASSAGIMVSRIIATKDDGPPANSGSKQNQRRITTVQATSKSWKLLLAIGALIVVVGSVGVFLGLAVAEESFIPGIATLITFVGIILVIIAMIGGWWFHG